MLRLYFFINSVLPPEDYREKRIIERDGGRCYLQEAIRLIAAADKVLSGCRRIQKNVEVTFIPVHGSFLFF